MRESVFGITIKLLCFFCLLLTACSDERDSPEVKSEVTNDLPSNKTVEDQLNAYLERQAVRNREYDLENRESIESWITGVVMQEIARNYQTPKYIVFDYDGQEVECLPSMAVALECYKLESLNSNRSYFKNEVSNKAKLNFLMTIAQGGFVLLDKETFSDGILIGVLNKNYGLTFQGLKSEGRIELPMFRITVLEIEGLRIGQPEPCRRSALVRVELEPVSDFGHIFLNEHGGDRVGRMCAAHDASTNISLAYPLRIKDIL